LTSIKSVNFLRGITRGTYIKAVTTRSDAQEIIDDSVTNTGKAWSGEKVNNQINGALTNYLKSVTVTVTTSANGNAFFTSVNELKRTNSVIVSIVCTSDNSTICVPYFGNDTYWGFHCMWDSATTPTYINKTVTVKVYYITI